MKFYYEKVKEIRKNNYLTINFIINKLGISQPTYWFWENGKRIPGEKKVRELAKVLNVSVNEISDLKEVIESSDDSSFFRQASEFSAIIDDESEELLVQQKAALNKLLNINMKFYNTASIMKSFINSLEMMFYVKDVKQNYVIVNKAFYTNNNLPLQYNVKGKKDANFYPKVDAEDNTREDQKVLNTGIPVQHRDGFLFGSKKKKVGRYTKYPIYDTQGKITGLIGFIDNITELNYFHGARLLIEDAIMNINANILIFNVPVNYSTYYVSPSIANLYGYRQRVFTKNPRFWFEKCLHTDNRDIVLEKLKEVKKDISVNFDYKIITSSKKIKEIKGTASFCRYLNKVYIAVFERKIKNDKYLSTNIFD